MRTLTLDPVANLTQLVAADEVVAFSVGPDRKAYLVLARPAADDRFVTNAAGSRFPKVVPAMPQHYRVLRIAEGLSELDCVIEDAGFHAWHVQPVHTGLLLACSRSYYRRKDDFDLNAHLFDQHGRHERSFLLGDGIQDIQVSAAGTIWVSYFDEGVFGNLGWENPVGAAGLLAWSSTGEKLYEFAPPSGLDSMADCYALNVESDSVTWCYYYTDFALVRICKLRAESHWQMPIHGSSCFAIDHGYALFNGGYKDKDRYSLFRITPAEKPKLLKQFELRLSGSHAGRIRAVGRGDAIWLLAGAQLYRLDIGTALTA